MVAVADKTTTEAYEDLYRAQLSEFAHRENARMHKQWGKVGNPMKDNNWIPVKDKKELKPAPPPSRRGVTKYG